MRRPRSRGSSSSNSNRGSRLLLVLACLACPMQLSGGTSARPSSSMASSRPRASPSALTTTPWTVRKPTMPMAMNLSPRRS
eukprot:3225325-Pyramimonas_sp.AAC.1